MNTELYLLRHGEPKIKNSLLGKTDARLTPLGWKQLYASMKSTSGVTKIISSSLLRCSEFAKEWASGKQLPIEINDDLQECNFGEWDGISFEQIKQNDPENLSRFLVEPASFTPPGGEALIDFQRRIRRVTEEILNQNAEEKILIVTHAGVIRCLISWCLKMDQLSPVPFQNIAIDYASLTRISIYHGEELFPQLKSMNLVTNIVREK